MCYVGILQLEYITFLRIFPVGNARFDNYFVGFVRINIFVVNNCANIQNDEIYLIFGMEMLTF